MASHDDHQSLFKAPPSTEATDGPGAVFDGSDEAMRQLRHPFAVPPADRRADPEDDAKQQD